MVNIGQSYVYLSFFVWIVLVESSSRSTVSSHPRRRRQSTTCVLPPHPAHGEWEILSGSGKPGETMPTNTLLMFKCNPQYKLSSTSPYVVCNKGWSSNMPNCQKLCPSIYSTLTTTVSCKDNDGRKIPCDEATDGTYLSYTCAPYYETAPRFKRVIFCFNGHWSSSQPVCQPVCGRRVDNDVLPIIAGGTSAKKLEFPWVVALYRKITKHEYIYICGGSIISRRLALTAAHCVADQYGNSLPVEKFQVVAGKLYSPYQDGREETAQYLDIHSIKITSQYRGGSRRFTGDLAILVTKEMFELSPVVQPVCFHGVNDMSLRVGHIGEIAGWGNTETDEPSDELKFLQIPYKTDDVCESELSREWSDKYNLIDKMCAGLRNQGKSLCKGDSGSGLAFKHSEDNRFYVYGVASLSPIGPEGKCNVDQNALYTKVAFYYDFIDRWIAVYQEQGCRLPPHPENGKYIVENRGSAGPGDIVFSTDILRVNCNKGYTLNGQESKMYCDTSDKMPKCERRNITSDCIDNGHFANCQLIVKGKYCHHAYYTKFCCESCTKDGQLPVRLLQPL